jgi:hypothetical protein
MSGGTVFARCNAHSREIMNGERKPIASIGRGRCKGSPNTHTVEPRHAVCVALPKAIGTRALSNDRLKIE